MTDTKLSIEFNQDNQLTFIAKGNLKEEININDDLKNKINELIEKSDTSNVLMRINNHFGTELDSFIQVAFENAVNKEYDEKNK